MSEDKHESVCPHIDEPLGCYRIRCQLGNKCVDAQSQPKREWVSLTDEEYQAILKEHDDGGLLAFYNLIEAKLREKNGG